MSLTVAMLAACGGGEQQAPAADAGTSVAVLTPDEKYSIAGKPQGPVKIVSTIVFEQLLITTILFVASTMISDIINAGLDPRIRENL